MSAKVKLSTVDGMSSASITVPTTHGTISVGAIGSSHGGALHNAALLAERIAQDPVMSELLPPGALPAIEAAKRLGAAAKAGLPALRALWGTLHGPGKQRLARALAAGASAAEHAEVGGFFESAAAAAMNPAGFAATQAAKLIARKLKQRKAKAKAKARADRSASYEAGRRAAQSDAPDNAQSAAPVQRSYPSSPSWEAQQAAAQGAESYDDAAPYDDGAAIDVDADQGDELAGEDE